LQLGFGAPLVVEQSGGHQHEGRVQLSTVALRALEPPFARGFAAPAPAQTSDKPLSGARFDPHAQDLVSGG
jgi:hypothetical protein